MQVKMKVTLTRYTSRVCGQNLDQRQRRLLVMFLFKHPTQGYLVGVTFSPYLHRAIAHDAPNHLISEGKDVVEPFRSVPEHVRAQHQPRHLRADGLVGVIRVGDQAGGRADEGAEGPRHHGHQSADADGQQEPPDSLHGPGAVAGVGLHE